VKPQGPRLDQLLRPRLRPGSSPLYPALCPGATLNALPIDEVLPALYRTPGQALIGAFDKAFQHGG